MNETRALMFIFTGEEPSNGLVKDLAGMLTHACNVSDHLEYYMLDSDDIAKILSFHMMLKVSKQEQKLYQSAQQKEYTPEEEAVIYIGTVMADVLGAAYKPEDFVATLTQKISEARIEKTEESKRFMNALFILSQEDLVISQCLLRKYKLNEKKLLLIKRVYNLVSTY